MKPYGKPSEVRHGCMCCSTRTEHRSASKSELRRLIIQESEEVVVNGNTVPKSEKNNFCPVCGDYKNESCAENC